MSSPIIALGASAGGLDALFELFSALPPKTGAAYVVIQHLDRDHKSLLAELIGKKTTMPVAQIGDGQEVKADHVFVIPPNTSLTVAHDRFHLSPRDTSASPHHPVDVFFASLAHERAAGSMAIVLSGGDSDGALGIKAVKDSGGITFAQTPESTKFPGMPQSAIDSGCVDFVLRPAEIANEIVRLSRHPYLLANGGSVHEPELTLARPSEHEERELKRVFRRLRSIHGVDFTHYKRSTLRRRLARRMALNRSDEIGSYVDGLETDAAETASLYQDFLIRVTGFFRDPELFEGLAEYVFPVICEARETNDPIRLWIAGCATGEEVYSIAIALMEYLGDLHPGRRIQIFGTDVSESAIEYARAGVYLDNISAEVSPERLARYFVKENGRYHVSKRIRELCVFARHDITRDPPFSRIELVSCRNLLIYLDNPAQRRVMRAFHYAITTRGFLALGLAETVGGASDLFDLVDKRHRIYSRKPGAFTMSLDGGDRSEVMAAPPRSVSQGESSMATERTSAHAEADRMLLARYAPASLLVDSSLNILQFRGETGRYLEHASGPPSLNVHRVVRPQLLVELAPAIQEARDSDEPVWRQGLFLDDQTDIALGVFPIQSSSAERCFLIVFESAAIASQRRAQVVPVPHLSESEKDRRIAQLERELASTRGFLQTTMEEQEAVREDLKSAHEEVLSANEEFQSTNEELETAKEELQSSNEELATTNDELLNSNRELSTLNIELKRSREIAVRAQSYADAIIASMRNPLLVLDRNLRVQRANSAFFDTFGLTPEATEGKTLTDVGGRQWDKTDLIIGLTKVLAQNYVLTNQEMVFRSTPTAAPRTLRLDAKTIPGDAERGELILLAMEDVTERRSHAAELELASQRKDEFLAMLAHELRNPLTPIAHAIHLLKRAPLDEPHNALLGMIERQTRRIVRLVDDLLDLARINRGTIELRNILLDLVSVVRNSAETSGARLEERGHELTISLPDFAVCVDGDPVRLEQIVSNLLENAAKYTDSGGRIAVKLTEQADHAVLSVRDNGIGISPDNLGAIFDLFNQVDGSLARSGGGLGIGLTLVRRVLELHGGSVEARSAGLGHGAEFIVKLPLSERSEKHLPAAEGEPESHHKAPSRRLLLVDDNVDAVESLQMLAQHWGHEVVVAYDGPKAIELVETFHPEIALVDIGLPGMDGYQIARFLRDKYPDLFLVAMTGYGREEDRLAAKAAGFDAHVVKPADLDKLETMLARGRAFVPE